MKTAFSIIFNISCDYNEIQIIKSSSVVESFGELYKNINKNREKLNEIDIQHPELKPVLRKYQVEAVRWMIEREQMPLETEMLHPLYQEVVIRSGIKIYFDKYTGYLDTDKPMTGSLRTGGILADEMGLGKTVEVFACILTHPRNNLESHNTETSSKNKVWPAIEKQSRKRKINTEKEDATAQLECTSKKLKVPEDWVKPSSRASSLRVALEAWYNKVLSNSPDIVEEPKVQCICGDISERTDCFECVDCSKVQHGKCLGYKKAYGEYICPQCWKNRPPLESNATLIVTPVSLKQQWCNEIRKHINGNLRVFLYEGSHNLVPVYPTKLQQYDLVITTYNVLQNELRLSENGQIVSLRRPPKYSLPGSPITLINWWRLCLDEAQTVETPGHMVSEMAKKIHAHHRWAVTGTPISKDISDLYGLIDYLQLAPYSEFDCWNNLFYKPYINDRKEAMHKFLAKILWRTCKADVINQIDIPQQTVMEHWIDFSNVETFFYQREHNLCSKEFLARLRNVDLNMLLHALNKSLLKKLMQPLLVLRQACCHHQAVKSKYIATRKRVHSMEDLLNALIAKNVQENEEYLRIIVSSLNGLAGIYLLLQNPNQAVEEYRKVLQFSARFCDKNSDIKLEIDKLQLIHTMYNLSEVLEIHPSVPPTLRDASIKTECKLLEKEYMERFTKQTLSTLQDSLKFSYNITQLQNKFRLNPGQWFADILDWITTNSLFEDYLGKLTTIMHSANIVLKGLSERKLLYMLAVWDEEITKLKSETVQSIHELFEMTEGEDSKMIIPTEVIEAATDCHLRPQKKSNKKKKKCPVCDANFYLKQYESKIFSTTQQDDDISNTGSWKPAPEEFMLRALSALGKQKNVSADILHDAEVHFHILDILKKEFKEIRKLWTYVDAQVCATDEVDMCKMRLRLKEKTDESESDRSQINRIIKQLQQIEENRFETIHMLDEHEVQYQHAVLTAEFKTNTTVLEKNLGTYKYLQTLHNQQTTGQPPDPCPICKTVLQKNWNILPCGHCYCVECIQVLVEQTFGQYISCSVCRSKKLKNDIVLVDSEKQQKNDNESVIKGNHSSKVEAVVRLVQQLRQKEHDVKVLVFSNWSVILKVIHSVFSSNDIKSEILQYGTFEKILDKFKDKSQDVTALLLPVHLGSKGLNLIEATHVIFVEPLLDPGDELQAIGRVHRIGQTKPTVVHKFFIRNTIEENIYHATTGNVEDWDSNNVTLGRIKQLFDVPSSIQESSQEDTIQDQETVE
ncbi:e3 ubiquitin-protein ligase shprh family member [Holotrichia oblita]|uniref:E3 ubiquitin-protein ligase shprh family member n=1 Tax=Holotrichia oblita TaxID=644536 RepID=A0ACB9SSG0_HOLOL|nr:e3 ubiquitin-protein ligase shprh family member [Holotrichia oblita]